MLAPDLCLVLRCTDRPAIRCRLTPGDVLVGRGRHATVRLDHPAVSARHCILHVEPGQVWVQDLGSANGTTVGRRELPAQRRVPLHPGDEVQVGPVRLSLARARGNGKSHALPVALAVVPSLGLSVSGLAGTRTVPVESPLLVGSDPACDVHLPWPGLAPQHARVYLADGAITVQAIGDADLWQEENRVRSAVLHEGQGVRLGKQAALRATLCHVLREIPQQPGTLDLSLVQKSEVLIGRAADCDHRLDHPGVSRRHARLRRRHAGWLVEDLSSLHGTFLDGERLLRPTMIREGQTLDIVGHRLTIVGTNLRQHMPSGVQSIDALRLSRRVRGGRAILHDVSLHAEAGELIAVVGSTGAGKSTLLNALCGFDPATSGQVLFDDRDLYRSYDLFRSQIGYVPQKDILHEALPLERALAYSAELRLPPPARARGDRESHARRIDSVLAELGLAKVRRQTISTLSGGERKRANIAAELVAAPSVLFLDEPGADLDLAVEEVLMGQLRELADDGRIVIVVTHITHNIMLCDKVAFLAPGGYLAYFGPPEESLEYFQVKAFYEIYAKLTSEESPKWWARQYLGSEAYRRHIQGPQARVRQPVTVPRRTAVVRAKRSPRLRQLAVLTRRYLDLLARDWRNLLMLFLQAPALAALMGMGFKRTSFDPTPAKDMWFTPPKGDGTQAAMILFFLAVVPIWFGIFNATREIVKELAVYRRERMATIDVAPYLLSKVIVLSLIAAVQVATFLALVALIIELPAHTFRDYSQLYVTMMMGALLGIGMGLFVSSVVEKPDKANTAMLFLVVPQLLLAGAFITVKDMGAVARFISLFAASRWSFENLGKQVDLLSILSKQSGPSKFIHDSYVDTFSINVTQHYTVMAVGVVLLLVSCYIALRWKDPI